MNTVRESTQAALLQAGHTHQDAQRAALALHPLEDGQDAGMTLEALLRTQAHHFQAFAAGATLPEFLEGVTNTLSYYHAEAQRAGHSWYAQRYLDALGTSHGTVLAPPSPEAEVVAPYMLYNQAVMAQQEQTHHDTSARTTWAQRAMVLVGAAGILQAFTLLIVASTSLRFALAETGSLTWVGLASDLDGYIQILNGVATLSTLVAGIAFASWLFILRRQASWYAPEAPFGPWGAWWSWIVPVLQYFWPYMTIRTTAKILRAHQAGEAHAWRGYTGSPVALAWCLSYLAMGTVTGLGSILVQFSALSGDADLMSTMVGIGGGLLLLGAFLTAAAAYFAVRTVSDVTGILDET